MKGSNQGEKPRHLSTPLKFKKVKKRLKNTYNTQIDKSYSKEDDCRECILTKQMKHLRTRKDFKKTEESLTKKHLKLTQHKDIFKTNFKKQTRTKKSK
jgi:hypothetical protein|tara:strand:+ start:19225 stop:19518 length:294 start_codon:yes stop_codon:yes gene_type:complete